MMKPLSTRQAATRPVITSLLVGLAVSLFTACSLSDRKSFDSDEDVQSLIAIEGPEEYEDINHLNAIENGEEGVSQNDPDLESELLEAARVGNLADVAYLLAGSVNPNAKDKENWTALMLAAEKGHQDIVQLFLADPRVEVNLENNNGETALDIAKRKKHKVVVNLLQKYIEARDLFARLKTHEDRLLALEQRNAIHADISPPPSNDELRQEIDRLATSAKEASQRITELKEKGYRTAAERKELSELRQELQRLDKEKASYEDLETLQRDFDSRLQEYDKFMDQHKVKLTELSRQAQNKNHADHKLAQALDGEAAQTYANHLILGLNRLHHAAMVGTSGYFSAKGKGFVRKTASFLGLVGKGLPVGSNFVDILAKALEGFDEYNTEKALSNVTKLVISASEMDKISDGVMRDLALNSTTPLNRGLSDQHLKRMLEALLSGELATITLSCPEGQKISRIARALCNIATRERIGHVRNAPPRRYQPAAPSRLVRLVNDSNKMNALEELVAAQKNSKTVLSITPKALREASENKASEAVVSLEELRFQKEGFRKPKGFRQKSLARKIFIAWGLIMDKVIFKDVELDPRDETKLKFALGSALVDRALIDASFNESFVSDDEATQDRVWDILKKEVEVAATTLHKAPKSNKKALAREAVRNLAAELSREV